ncbi:hypothetical protein N665_0065s0109 [Sinapis alba]|nr:hypothetical protein N665_0065s0109 [Sinapis alba]
MSVTLFVADAVWSNIESTGSVTEEQLSTLHLLFGKNLEKATRIIDKRGVKKISGLPSGRSIFQVVGESQKREEYLCFPGDYCGCYSFFYDVVSRGEQQCCKHQLAARLASSLGTYSEIEESSTKATKRRDESHREAMEVITDEVTATATEFLGRNEQVEAPNAVVLADGVVTAEERKIERDNGGERKTESETPPDDDCCPICFGSFTVPCRGDCGHWYCGSCILQYWNYAAVSRPCKCPMCVRHITKLTPEASLQERQEQEVKEVLAKIRRYNRLFVGGLTGFVQVQELPLLMKRMVWHMMDPDTNNLYFNEVRIFAMLMSTLYTASEFNFIPTGGFRIVTVFDYGAIAMILILRLVGIYRRRRLAQRVRHVAAAELEQE